ncbi:MAG: ABC transporter permease [Thaumarchaeota archaeon]|nr:ABC transporter permease [Nitrososphaerota archaeon]
MMHDQSDIIIRTIQPVLWLTIFGSVFGQLRQVPLSGVPYLAYMTPGVLAQSVLFMAIFTGVSLVWERDLGQLDRLLCAPIPRTAIVLGKALTGGVKGLFQAGIIFAIALVMGVSIIFNPLYMAAVIAVVLLFGICFSSLSIFVMTLLKTRERVMGIVQLITMPLFFASNALYPIELMPRWLQAISFANPMTYVVAALRALMITGDLSGLPTDLAGMGLATVIFVVLASAAFRKIGA